MQLKIGKDLTEREKYLSCQNRNILGFAYVYLWTEAALQSEFNNDISASEAVLFNTLAIFTVTFSCLPDGLLGVVRMYSFHF